MTVVAKKKRNMKTPRPTQALFRLHSLAVPVVVSQEGPEGRSASARAPGALDLESLTSLS